MLCFQGSLRRHCTPAARHHRIAALPYICQSKDYPFPTPDSVLQDYSVAQCNERSSGPEALNVAVWRLVSETL